jgi:hypothetical protein
MRARTRRRHVAAAVVGVGFGVIAAASPALAADRAYELVTPPGSSGKVIPGTGMSTPDGNVVCFDAENAVAGASENGEIAPDGFCSWRTASGWETKWVTGPEVTEPRSGNGSATYFISPDGSRVVFASDKGIYPDYGGSPPGGGRPSTPSAFMWEGGGMPRWLAPAPQPLQDPNSDRKPLAASDDLRYGLFESGLRLLPEDTNTVTDVYEWTPDGIRLVSRDASGAAVGGTVPRRSEFASPAGAVSQPGAFSRDGSRIFFHHTGPLVGGAPATGQSVFMRDGDELRLVSPRRGGDTPVDVNFAGATDDGKIVYLQTAERLTPETKEAGNAIYRYDVESDTLALAATDPWGLFFLGLSADGSTLVLRNDNWELLVLRDDVMTKLGDLDAMDIFDYNTVAAPVFTSRGLRIAPDGSAVVFSALGAFDGVAPGRRQVYRWTPAQGLRRISATADGAPPAGDANIGNFSVNTGVDPRNVRIANNLRGYPHLGRVLADDGRVFFESQEQLVPTDVNDYVDVYEWQDGVVRLISPGTQRAAALYHESSSDGNTVFFTTSARLIPELDRNTVSDLYAARVGGGFPLPPRTQACDGDRCQGTLLPPPVSQPPGTTVFNGPGDVQDAAPPLPRYSVVSITAKQRRGFARSGRTVLRVRATANGVVTATGRARVGRRTVRVARSTAAVRGGTTVRVPLSLSRQARNVLRTKRKLRVVISVSYSESETSVQRVVVLRG